jgi:AraC-like DNA-binding protein
LSDYYVTTESLGVSYGVEVSFTPLGVYVFLGVPTHVFAEHLYALNDVLGPSADLLTEQVACAPDWQTRFDFIDAFIASRFARACLPSRQIEGAYEALRRSGGRCSVGSLADDAGWSEKHFVERFREQVGLAPKTMGRIIRFNRAVMLLEAPEAVLADVVFRAGYYDQPHMNRDFRQFTGASPTEFLKQSLPEGAGLRDD